MAGSIDKSWNMHKCTSVTNRSTASVFFKEKRKKNHDQGSSIVENKSKNLFSL